MLASLPSRRGGFAIVAMLLLAPALFAANMVAARWAHQVGLPPVFLAFGRWACAFLLLLPFVGRELVRQRARIRSNLAPLSLLALLGMALTVAPQYIGARTVEATNVALIFALSPVLVVVLETLLCGAHLRGRQVLGLLLALLGVLVVLSKGDAGFFSHLRFGVGDAWLMLGSLAWAGYTVLLKRRPPQGLTPCVRMACLMFAGCLILAPWAVLEAVQAGVPPLAEPSLWGTLLFLALVPSLGAYLLYARLVDQAGADRASGCLYLIPLYCALLAWPLLGEVPQFYHLLGMLLVLPGVALAAWHGEVAGRVARLARLREA